MWIVSPIGVPTILRCWSVILTRTRRSTFQRCRIDEGFASVEYCVEATGSTARVFGAPNTHPAGSRFAQGMGDREFGFDEEKFVSAQAADIRVAHCAKRVCPFVSLCRAGTPPPGFGEDWVLEKPCSALDCEGVSFANARADSSCVDETSLSTDFAQGDLSSSNDDVSWASLGSK
eukprot:5435638-Amphidinium_carterae.1